MYIGGGSKSLISPIGWVFVEEVCVHVCIYIASLFSYIPI